MKVSIYDSCLLFIINGPHDFSIIGMQIDNTFGFATSRFSKREQDELYRKKFYTKDKNILSPEQLIKFNRGRIKFSRDNITFI